MTWTRRMAVLGALFAVLAGVPVALVTLPANAAPGDCKTVTTKLTNRPDGGNGSGSWAVDTITRTVEVCQLAAPSASATVAAKAVGPIAYVDYSVKGSDVGTFVTNGGATLSPNNGQSLVAGRHGKLAGSFEFFVSAPIDFAGFSPPAAFSGTINGDPKSSPTDDNPGTSEWIMKWWPNAEPKIRFNEKNWSWIYWLCGDQPSRTNPSGFHGEYWWDAASGLSQDGTTPLAGDIRGVQVCPSQSASTPAVSATPTPSSTSPAVGLPLTGPPVGKIAAGAAGVIAIGALLAWWGKRRRVKFTAG